jgi:bifunctional DNA-binding transcriptional regulator/antitoxin component of YhaV-PrlF toxin-antitoxin module
MKGLSEPKARYRAAGPADTKRGAGLVGGRRKLPAAATLPDGTVRHFLVLGPKGRVLLPAEMRTALGLEEGDVITGWVKDGEVRMHSYLHGLRKIQEGASSLAKGSAYASNELIAERRAEAVKKDEEALQWLRDRSNR